MARNDLSAIVASLNDILASEREHLLAGRLGALTGTTQTKEALLERLSTSNAPAEEIERLRKQAERNQALLSAAARGIGAARDRIATLRSTPLPTRTYARNGTATEIGGRMGPGVNHRA